MPSHTPTTKKQPPSSATSKALAKLRFVQLVDSGHSIQASSDAVSVTRRTGTAWMKELRTIAGEAWSDPRIMASPEEDLLLYAAQLRATIDLAREGLKLSGGRASALDRLRLIYLNQLGGYTLRRASDIVGTTYTTARNWLAWFQEQRSVWELVYREMIEEGDFDHLEPDQRNAHDFLNDAVAIAVASLEFVTSGIEMESPGRVT